VYSGLLDIGAMKTKNERREEKKKEYKKSNKIFMPVVVDTSVRVYDDFSRLLFLHHWEASALSNEIPEESEQFRFLRAACYSNIKGSVGLIFS
jgi:hypothetical protein